MRRDFSLRIDLGPKRVNSLISHFSTKCEIVPMRFLFKIRSVCFTEGDFTGSCDWSLFPRKVKSLHLAEGRHHSMRHVQAASLNLSVTTPWRCTVIDLMSAHYWIFVCCDYVSVCACVSGGWVVWRTTSTLIFYLVWDRVILLPAAVCTILGNPQAPKKFHCIPQRPTHRRAGITDACLTMWFLELWAQVLMLAQHLIHWTIAQAFLKVILNNH